MIKKELLENSRSSLFLLNNMNNTIICSCRLDYPNTIQNRYIGDAIELGYTIKSTGADDSIVHIVQ